MYTIGALDGETDSVDIRSTVQRQKALTGYFTSDRLVLFGFARQRCRCMKVQEVHVVSEQSS